MAQAIAARKRRKEPNPIQGIEIAVGAAGVPKRSLPSKNWRHAMSLRNRTFFRRLFVASALALPFVAASANAAEALRPVRELNATKPRQPKLSRLLEKLKKKRSSVDTDVKTRKLTAQEGDALRQDLAAIEKKARAMVKKRRDLRDESAKSLDSKLDEIGQKVRT
jgi:septal ring factor EnvC (AmiA/AmiB activator)